MVSTGSVSGRFCNAMSNSKFPNTKLSNDSLSKTMLSNSHIVELVRCQNNKLSNSKASSRSNNFFNDCLGWGANPGSFVFIYFLIPPLYRWATAAQTPEVTTCRSYKLPALQNFEHSTKCRTYRAILVLVPASRLVSGALHRVPRSTSSRAPVKVSARLQRRQH
jgi:hypothetical protein